MTTRPCVCTSRTGGGIEYVTRCLCLCVPFGFIGVILLLLVNAMPCYVRGGRGGHVTGKGEPEGKRKGKGKQEWIVMPMHTHPIHAQYTPSYHARGGGLGWMITSARSQPTYFLQADRLAGDGWTMDGWGFTVLPVLQAALPACLLHACCIHKQPAPCMYVPSTRGGGHRDIVWFRLGLELS